MPVKISTQRLCASTTVRLRPYHHCWMREQDPACTTFTLPMPVLRGFQQMSTKHRGECQRITSEIAMAGGQGDGKFAEQPPDEAIHQQQRNKHRHQQILMESTVNPTSLTP